MKRIALALLLTFITMSFVNASSTEDIQFKQYVDATKANLDEGMSVTADEKYRIIVLTMPIAMNLQDATPAVIKTMKQEIIKAMQREKAEIRIVKALKIYFIFNYVTIDKKLLAIPLCHQEL